MLVAQHPETNTTEESMKTTRHHAGLYYVTGTVAGAFSQYSLSRSQDGWRITRTYGHGPIFHAIFATKRAAVDSLKACDTARVYA